MIGQIARGVNGEWKVIPTHEDIVEDALVTLDRKPEIMQSIGPGRSCSVLSTQDYVLMKMSYFVRNIHLS